MAKFNSEAEIIEAIIKTANAEEGYLEKASNDDLYSKTGNAGYANFTKYWADLTEWGAMKNSGIKPGSGFAGGGQWYWCAAFVTWCFVSVLGIENATKLLLHMPFISCQTLGTKAQATKQLSATPKVGSVVLFFNGSRFSHTGYVYAVDAKTFYTIEGNTNNSKSVVANGGAVCKKAYNISTYRNKGARFFYPNYSQVLGNVVSAPASKPVSQLSSTISSTKKVRVNTQNDPLNCRLTATGAGKLIGTFDKGTELTLLEKTSSSWWKVTGKGSNGNILTGFCSTKYLVLI